MRNSKNPRILVVDDEYINLVVVQNQLSLKNYEVVTEQNGILALEEIKKNSYDLVILDIMMPEMSGIEVCRKIREIFPKYRLPIIMLTTKNRVEDIVVGMESGANDYISKPFEMQELFIRVSALIELKLELEKEKVSNILLSKAKNALDVEVEDRNRDLKLLLDNSGQGFLSFKRDLIIENEYSIKCEKIFNKKLNGLKIFELFNDTDIIEIEMIESILKKVFDSEKKDKINLLLNLLPTYFEIRELKIIIKMVPVFNNKSEKIEKMIFIFNDITDKRLLENRIQIESENLKTIVIIIKSFNDFKELIEDYKHFYKTAIFEMLSNEDKNEEKFYEIFRKIHTFKGSFDQFNMKKTVEKLHEFENKLEKIKKLFIKDDVKISKLILNELELNKNMKLWLEDDLIMIKRILGDSFLLNDDILLIDKNKLTSIENNIGSKLSYETRNIVLMELYKLKFKKVKTLFENFIEYTQKIAAKSNKKVNIVFKNEDLEIDVERYRSFTKTLVHIFRNIIDHGIENSKVRVDKGKEEYGTIKIEFEKTQKNITISISDDGKGIDVEKIKMKLLNEKMFNKDEIEGFSKERLLEFIFNDNFSTKMNVTSLSGRGEGMAIIKNEINLLGGEYKLETKKGKGTKFLFKLPRLESYKFYDINNYEFINIIIFNTIIHFNDNFDIKFNKDYKITENFEETYNLKGVLIEVLFEGVYSGKIIINLDKRIAIKIIDKFMFKKVSQEELAEYINDGVQEVFNIVFGNSISDCMLGDDLINVKIIKTIQSDSFEIVFPGIESNDITLESEQGQLNFIFLNN